MTDSRRINLDWRNLQNIEATEVSPSYQESISKAEKNVKLEQIAVDIAKLIGHLSCEDKKTVKYRVASILNLSDI